MKPGELAFSTVEHHVVNMCGFMQATIMLIANCYKRTPTVCSINNPAQTSICNKQMISRMQAKDQVFCSFNNPITNCHDLTADSRRMMLVLFLVFLSFPFCHIPAEMVDGRNSHKCLLVAAHKQCMVQNDDDVMSLLFDLFQTIRYE